MTIATATQTKNPLKKLTDEALLAQTKSYVRKERELTVEILQSLREIEIRRLFAAQGFPSLFEFCVKSLGYSEGAAQRRIVSMRLLKDLPEVEEQIANGELSLSVVCQASRFFKDEGIQEPEDKKEILNALANLSDRNAEKELASRAKEPPELPKERRRPITAKLSKLEIVIETELLDQIEELRALLSHARPNMTVRDAITHAVGIALEKHRPKLPKNPAATLSANENTQPQGELGGKMSDHRDMLREVITAGAGGSVGTRPSTLANSPIVPRPISSRTARDPSTRRSANTELKRQVWHRDGGQCTYVDAKTGRVCGSRSFLQIDHVMPYALGGKTDAGNLRLLCFQHNQLAAMRAGLQENRVKARVKR